MMQENEEKIALLISMGFPESQARQALDLCQGNIDMAVDRILSGQAANVTSSFTGLGAAEAALAWPSREEEGDIVQAANGINQYSFSDGGSSACTCIALHVASSALKYLNNHCHRHHHIDDSDHHSHNNIQNDEKNEAQKSSTNDKTTVPEARKFFTAERLQSLLCHGVEMYRVLKNGQGIGSSSLAVDTDHFSPEDVLALLDSTTTLAQWNVSLKLLDCGIRQGLLRRRDIDDATSSHQRAEPAIMGLKEILDDCHHLVPQQQESLGGNEWMCAIITKPPETICVFLPPLRNRDDSFQETQPFILVDSHPRPGLGIEGAYAKFHSSLDSLVTTLSTDIFPFTDLGNDDDNEAGDWMTAMYNSFDVYPFTFREGGRK